MFKNVDKNLFFDFFLKTYNDLLILRNNTFFLYFYT